MSSQPVGEGGASWNPARAQDNDDPEWIEQERAIRELRSEVRLDAQDLELIAGELGDATRDLMDALIDAGMDGHEVMLEIPTGTLTGRIVHAGQDLVTIETGSGSRVIVVVDRLAGVRISPGRSDSARVVRGHPMTLVAELRRRVAMAEVAEIQPGVGEPVLGVVKAVSSSHAQLLTDSGATWILPLASIVAVR